MSGTTGKCANCGADLNGAKFCAKCGTPAAASVDPKAIECIETGNDHFERGKFDNAIKEYDKALKIAPKYAEAYYRRGLAYYKLSSAVFTGKKNYEKAKSDFKEATILNPSHAEAWFMRGMSSSDWEHLTERLSFYNEAIRLNPDYAQAYYQRGRHHHGKDNFNAAVVDYETAMRLDPSIDANKLLEGARLNKSKFDCGDYVP